MTDDRERWALILGASSGMGEATALALAEGRLQHRRHPSRLPRGARPRRGGQGRDRGGRRRGAVHQHERRRRREARRRPSPRSATRFDAARAGRPRSRTSASSCTRSPSARSSRSSPTTRRARVDRKKMEMTQDVMANSLVYWVQDLWRGGFLEQGSKIYAMTSEGSTRVVPSYGVVSSAKAALESHIRQLAMELARTRDGDHRQRDPGRRDDDPGAHEDPRARHDHRRRPRSGTRPAG